MNGLMGMRRPSYGGAAPTPSVNVPRGGMDQMGLMGVRQRAQTARNNGPGVYFQPHQAWLLNLIQAFNRGRAPAMSMQER